MTNLKRKVTAGIATGALLANAMTPMAFAGTELTISGNGANSDNDVVLELDNETKIDQENKANFTNNINGDADTGDNDANKNTGGEVAIDTGDATTDVTVNNSANTNHAEVDCCASKGDIELKIDGNGADSKNTINLQPKGKDTSNIEIDQKNKADFDNKVNVDSETGNNDANKNTGGDVEITTGDASTTVEINNWANANSARVGGGDHDNGTLSLWISENGADSDNDIVVELDNEVKVDQDNDADFDNKVNADSDTGDNDANKNTGGEVAIDTGDATVDITVDNMANFNWADLNCGCILDDVTAKIAGNGYDSDNNIEATLEGEQKVDQDNDADFDNKVKHSDAETGNNDANKNTGEGDSDPSIDTGDAEFNAAVSNSANQNGVGGDGPDWDDVLPYGGISINLDFGDLLDYLGL